MINFLIFIFAIIALALLVLGCVFIRRYINRRRQSLSGPERVHLRSRNRPLISPFHTRENREVEALFEEELEEDDAMGRLPLHEWPNVEPARGPMNSIRSASQGESYTSVLVAVPGEEDDPHRRHFRTSRSSQGQGQVGNTLSALYIPHPTHHAIAGFVLARNTDEQTDEEYEQYPFATIVFSSKKKLEAYNEQCRAQRAEIQTARRAWQKRDLRRAKASRRPSSTAVFGINESTGDTGPISMDSHLYRLHSSSSSTSSFLASSRSPASSGYYLTRVPSTSSGDAASPQPYRLQRQSFRVCACSSYSSPLLLAENDMPNTEKEEEAGSGEGRGSRQEHQKGGKIHERNCTTRERSGGGGTEHRQREKGTWVHSYGLSKERGSQRRPLFVSETNASPVVLDRKEAHRKHSSQEEVARLSSSSSTAVNASEEAVVLCAGEGMRSDPTLPPISIGATTKQTPMTTHTTLCSATGGGNTTPPGRQEEIRPIARIEAKTKAEKERKQSNTHDAAEKENIGNAKKEENVDSHSPSWTRGIASVSSSSFSSSISSCPPASLVPAPSFTAPPLPLMESAASRRKDLFSRLSQPLTSPRICTPQRDTREADRASPISPRPTMATPLDQEATVCGANVFSPGQFSPSLLSSTSLQDGSGGAFLSHPQDQSPPSSPSFHGKRNPQSLCAQDPYSHGYSSGRGMSSHRSLEVPIRPPSPIPVVPSESSGIETTTVDRLHPPSRPSFFTLPSLEPPSLSMAYSDFRSMTPPFLDWEGMGGGEGTSSSPKSGETCLLTLYQPPSLERKTVWKGNGREKEHQDTKAETPSRRSMRTTSLSTPSKRISSSHMVCLHLPETDEEEQRSTLSGEGLTDTFTNSTRTLSQSPFWRPSPRSCVERDGGGGGGAPFSFQNAFPSPSLLRASPSASSLLSSPSLSAAPERGEKTSVKNNSSRSGGGGRDEPPRRSREVAMEKKKEEEEAWVPLMKGKPLLLSSSIRRLSSSASPLPSPASSAAFSVPKGKPGEEHTLARHPLCHAA